MIAAHHGSASPINYRKEVLSELNKPILTWLLFFTLLSAWVLLIPASGRVVSSHYALTLALFGWAVVSLRLAATSYLAGTIGLISGLTFYVLGQLLLAKAVIFVFAVPAIVLITVLLAGRRVSTAVALGFSIALIAFRATIFEPEQAGLFWPILLQTWFIVGLFTGGMAPLYQLVDWSWSNFLTSQQHIEEIRATVAQLVSTIRQRDIAYEQLERLNAKLAASRSLAEEQRRLKAIFAANISHELRTPINMIVGFAEMILNSPRSYNPAGLPNALLADLEVIYRNSHHLSLLIDDVLDMSQVSANRLVLQKTYADLRVALREAVDQVRPMAETQGLAITLCTPDRPVALLHDPLRIRQVCLNLLSNAIRLTEQGIIEVRLQSRSAEVQISVEDTGPGMTVDVLERVFEPFFQADASARRELGGTGLGLAISYEIVSLHEGRMWVESAPDQGSTFHFTLPALEHGASVDPVSSEPVSPAGRHLVVHEPLSHLKRYLNRSGYWSQISVAETPEQVARLASQSPVDAVIMRSGDDFFRDGTPCNDDLPLIVCQLPDLRTAYPSVQIVARLVKPILSTALLDAVAAVDGVRRILVVDDDPDMVRLITRWLTSRPDAYEVWSTCSGHEALALLDTRLPDLVLVDLAMAEISGFHLLAYMNASLRFSSARVIVVSALDNDYQESAGAGASFTVTTMRGIHLQRLCDCVELLVNQLNAESR